jgi:hypothetical protein
MLTATQTLVAADLLSKRPAVLPGTRVILNDNERTRYYDEVTKAMQHHGVKTPQAVNTFCDLAGVPD